MGQDACRDPSDAQPAVLGLNGNRKASVRGGVELLTLRHLQTFSGKLSQRSLTSLRDALLCVFTAWAIELRPLRVVKANSW